ncbi:ABC transporter ATP-binding protein [Paenibacillus monticola]|nr:ABC transporter ATP-binding protein [Paenibacillus monticola]
MFKKWNFPEFFRMMSLMQRQLWNYLITLCLIAGIYSAHMILLAFINERLLNGAISGDQELLTSAIVLTCVVLVLACITSPIAMYLFDLAVHRALTHLKLRLFKKIQDLPVSYLEKRHSGDLISAITNDVNSVEQAYRYHLYLLVEAIFYGTGSTIAMFVLDWRLSMLMVVLGMASAYFTTKYAGPLREIGDKVQTAMSDMTVHWVDMVGGFRLLKVFKISGFVLERFGQKNEAIVAHNIERIRLDSQLKGINYLLSIFSLIGVFVVGSFMVASGEIDFGTVMGIVTLQNGVAFLFLNFGNFFTNLQGSLAGSKRIYDILNAESEPDHYNTSGSSKGDEAISLRGLDFSYDGREKVLQGLSFDIRPGQVAALVGPSGSGKSTVIKLLLGFYEPTGGNLSINGRPLSAYTLEELRDQIAYVPQEAFLFEGTIEENIAHGRPDATHDDVVRAVKLANAHEFISDMSQGYATRVGERGIRLSGGQRQRIAIARAILRDAPILLLDEATSALDTASEQLVLEALQTLMKGRTTVAIAHRLKTIEHADVIFVLEKGKIVEKGTHHELLKQEGVYSRLHNIQFAESLT